MKDKTIAIITGVIVLILLITFLTIKLEKYALQSQIKIDCRKNFADQYCLQINSEVDIVYANYEFKCIDINERTVENIRYKLLQSELNYCESLAKETNKQ